MKICVVGGIFDAPEAYKAKHTVTPETTLVDGLKKFGIDVHAAGHRSFRPLDDYEIVHIHHIGKAALKMASESSRSFFVFTSHTGGHVNGYERSIIRRNAYRYILARADALVALSQKEALHLEGMAPRKTVRVIPNGIPAGLFTLDNNAAGKQAAANSHHELLYVGQLIKLKGVDVLLDAFKILTSQWQARLRLVYHNAQLEAACKHRVQELGLTGQVDFVGSVASTQLAQWYRRADVVVLPSYTEALPSVVTKALLCGKPVVATAVGGIPEQLGRYGRLVSPGNAAELAAALDSVLRNLPHFRTLAGEMRRHAEDRFGVDAMVKAHLRLYEDLLQNGAKKQRPGWFDPLVRFAIRTYWAKG